MNRNSQNHFRSIPDIEINRSKFRRPFTHKTTFNSGDIIPFYVDEILPGDTVQMDMSAAVRMATPIFAVMDNAYIDTYFFYTPFRLVWEHYAEFMGENKLTAWEQPVEYEIPQIQAPEGGWQAGTIADYMGVPTKVDNFTMSALYYRAYALIWNEWFRDQNLKDAAMVNLDETTVTGTNDGDYVINAQLGAKPLKAARFHSYFTSALPEPQKGPDVLLPIGNMAPVKTSETPIVTGQNQPMHFTWNNGTYATNNATMYATNGNLGLSDSAVPGATVMVYPDNLYADLATAQAATVNQLRQAFAVQRLYERDARGGKKNCASSIKKPFLIDLEDLKRGRQGASVMVA